MAVLARCLALPAAHEVVEVVVHRLAGAGRAAQPEELRPQVGQGLLLTLSTEKVWLLSWRMTATVEVWLLWWRYDCHCGGMVTMVEV